MITEVYLDMLLDMILTLLQSIVIICSSEEVIRFIFAKIINRRKDMITKINMIPKIIMVAPKYRLEAEASSDNNIRISNIKQIGKKNTLPNK